MEIRGGRISKFKVISLELLVKKKLMILFNNFQYINYNYKN